MAAHDSHHVIEHTGCLRPGVARALAAAVAAVHVLLIAVVLRGDMRIVPSEMAGRAGTGTVFASLVPNVPAATAAAGAPISASDAGKPRAEAGKTTRPIKPRTPEAGRVVAAERTPETPAEQASAPDAGEQGQGMPSREPSAEGDGHASGSAAPASSPGAAGGARDPFAGRDGGGYEDMESPVALSSLKFKRAQKPDYPEQSRSRNESGVVAVLVVVDAEGRVGEARIKQSCGHALLDDAALKAARRSRFHPYVEDGVHKTVVTVIPYHFNLHAAR